MEQLPKYFIFDRRIVGSLETAKRLVEALAAASTSEQLASFFGVDSSPHLTLALILLRAGLSAVTGMATIGNPINIAATVTQQTQGEMSQTNTKTSSELPHDAEVV